MVYRYGIYRIISRQLFIFPFRFPRRRTACHERSDVSRDYTADSGADYVYSHTKAAFIAAVHIIIHYRYRFVLAKAELYAYNMV